MEFGIGNAECGMKRIEDEKVWWWEDENTGGQKSEDGWMDD